MSIGGDQLNAGAGIFHEVAGILTVTLSDGTNSDVITSSAWGGEVQREKDPDGGLERQTRTWRLRSGDVVNVTPSEGNTVTHGAVVWEVDDVDGAAQAGEWLLRTSRTVQVGAV